MSEPTTIEQLTSTPEGMEEFQRARLELELTELIFKVMKREGITRTELAKRLNTKRATVTKILEDASNLPLCEISDIFHAMGCSLRLVARPLSLATIPLVVEEAMR